MTEKTEFRQLGINPSIKSPRFFSAKRDLKASFSSVHNKAVSESESEI